MNKPKSGIPDPDYEAKLRVVLRVQERMAKRVDKFDEAIKYLREEDRILSKDRSPYPPSSTSAFFRARRS